MRTFGRRSYDSGVRVFGIARAVRIGAFGGLLTLVLALLPAAVTAPAVGALRPPLRLQTAKKCVTLWNGSSPLARRSAVARLGPITAMVVGAGVPVIDAKPRCAVLVMVSNGSWYATQTSSLDRPRVTWSPLTRLAAGTAASYNIANGDHRVVRSARVLDSGKLRLL